MAVTFPVAVVVGGALHRVFRGPVDFVGPDGIQHPREAWTCWADADWAVMCPGWALVPLLDSRPADTLTHTYSQAPETEWTVSADAVTVTYAGVARPLADCRSKVVEAINKERNARLALGAPYGGKLIDVSDKGRADLAGMMLAGLLAQSDQTAWTDGYSTGWITMDNTRLALPEPGDGIALARAVGAWYGATMQRARDLKDAALVSDAPETINILAGWPE